MKNINLKDYEEIRRVAQLYVDGCAKGDGDYMKPAFHQSATINGAPIQTLLTAQRRLAKPIPKE